MDNIINKIYEKDRVFGKLCQEAKESYRNENYFAAISCLFVLAEQVVKYSLNKNNGNFHELLQEAETKMVITRNEFLLLNKLRELRNKLFHENHYSLALVWDGINYPVDEDETKKIIYEKSADYLFGIVLKIV